MSHWEGRDHCEVFTNLRALITVSNLQKGRGTRSSKGPTFPRTERQNMPVYAPRIAVLCKDSYNKWIQLDTWCFKCVWRRILAINPCLSLTQEWPPSHQEGRLSQADFPESHTEEISRLQRPHLKKYKDLWRETPANVLKHTSEKG